MSPRDHPWIDKDLKSKFNRKNRLSKEYVKRGHKEEIIFNLKSTAQIVSLRLKKQNKITSLIWEESLMIPQQI